MLKTGSGFLKPINLVLKEAREKRNIPLEIAHRDTKIHIKILRALEEGSALDLAPVYINSYIKIYGKYLGIDEAELDRYLHRDTKEQSGQTQTKQPPDSFNVYGGQTKNFSFQLNPRKIIYVIVGLFLLVSFFKFVRGPKDLKKEKEPAKQTISFSAQLKPKTDVNKSSQAVENKIQQEASVALPQVVQDILRLTIFAEEDTWMQIKADGRVVFTRILKKSTSETWEAKDSFELWLANAGTVRLELNGRILPPIGRRGQVLKNIIINKEGFSTKR